MKKLVATGCLIMFLLTGCTFKSTERTTAESTTEITTAEATTEITTAEATTFISKRIIPESAICMTEGRKHLSEKLQALYDEFYQKILRYEEFEIETRNTSEYNYFKVHEVLDALREDHPEFWLYLNSYDGDGIITDDGTPIEIYSLSIKFEYTWLIRDEFYPEKMEQIMSEMDEICDEIISRMPDGTLEEKYLFLAKEIANRTIYVSDYYFETDADVDWSYCHMNGPLLNGEGLCQAYAQAYQYLCNRAGLWCLCIEGNSFGEAHCWNMIKTESGTYHVDVTWCDSSEEFETYFLLTQEKIEFDHTPDEGEPIATGK